MKGKMESAKELPRVFIGSSAEGLEVAQLIQEELEYDADTAIWHQSIFQLSSNILDDLISVITTVDFGIFIFSLDDVLKIRGQEFSTVRDNVIFELGLSVGSLGKERNFIILPRDHREFHLPTDILGIIPATYNANRSDRNLRAAIGPACNKIRMMMQKFGILKRINNSDNDRSDWQICERHAQVQVTPIMDSLQYPKEATKDKEHYLRCGDVYFDLKLYSEALSAYERSIELDPDCANAYVKKADVLQSLKQYEAALASYKKAVCLDLNLFAAYTGQGDTFRKLERFEEALTAYKHAIMLDPCSASAHTGKGDILGRLGRYEEALVVCEHAISLDHDYAPAYDRKATILGALEQFKEALIVHEQAIKLDPSNAKFHNNRGVTLKAYGCIEEALSAFERAIQLDHTEGTFHNNRNTILRVLGRQEEVLVSCI